MNDLFGKLLEFVLISIIVVLSAGLIFVFADSAMIDLELESHYAVSREYSPGYFQTQTTTVNKVTTTTQIWIPESWDINVSYNNMLLSCSATQEQYNDFIPDKKLQVFIGKGRFSNSVYCEGVN